MSMADWTLIWALVTEDTSTHATSGMQMVNSSGQDASGVVTICSRASASMVFGLSSRYGKLRMRELPILVFLVGFTLLCRIGGAICSTINTVRPTSWSLSVVAMCPGE